MGADAPRDALDPSGARLAPGLSTRVWGEHLGIELPHRRRDWTSGPRPRNPTPLSEGLGYTGGPLDGTEGRRKAWLRGALRPEGRPRREIAQGIGSETRSRTRFG